MPCYFPQHPVHAGYGQEISQEGVPIQHRLKFSAVQERYT